MVLELRATWQAGLRGVGGGLPKTSLAKPVGTELQTRLWGAPSGRRGALSWGAV